MRLEGHNVLLNQHKSQCRIEPKLKSHSSDVTTEFLIRLARIGLNHSTLLGRHNPRVIQGSVPGQPISIAGKNGPGGLILLLYSTPYSTASLTVGRLLISQTACRYTIIRDDEKLDKSFSLKETRTIFSKSRNHDRPKL